MGSDCVVKILFDGVVAKRAIREVSALLISFARQPNSELPYRWSK